MEISFNMYITLSIAVVVLILGKAIKNKAGFLKRFCIPESVVGGLVFSLLTLILHVTGLVTVTFDTTLSDLFRVLFFTTVGFMANFKTLREGGKSLVVFLLSLVLLILCQNLIAAGIASLIGLSPLTGLCTGSVPMVGGHGTAGAFGPLCEKPRRIPDFGRLSRVVRAYLFYCYYPFRNSIIWLTEKHLKNKIFFYHCMQ